MPSRTRQYSAVPSMRSMLRSPLWPAAPPPRFTRTLPGTRSNSSWNAVICAGSSLKNEAAACTLAPLSFM